MSLLVAAALAMGTLVACSESHNGCPSFPYCDGGPSEPDAGTDADSDAWMEPDAGEPDATPPCVPVAELCDGVDDDCDGTVDETPAETGCVAPNATPACESGACAIAECDVGFADCDADASNGCETETDTDASACGACGAACGDGIECHDGVCDDQRIVHIAAGRFHACALRRSGEALCWGYNSDGQLGTGDRDTHLTATPVSGSFRYQQLVAGGRYTCGLLIDGRAACWGDNTVGELGDGTTVAHPEPQLVVDLAGIVSLASGSVMNPHVLALNASGEVWGWGNNNFGALGEATRGSGAVPLPILVGFAPASAVAASTGLGCALLATGAGECRGLSAIVPPELSEPRWTMLTVGYPQSCVMDRAGDLYCWRALGPYPCTDCGVLLPFDLGSPVLQAEASSAGTCAIVAGGAVYCWGGSREPFDPPPSLVPDIEDVVSIAMNASLRCALDARGRVWCWNGTTVGDGSEWWRASPVRVAGIYDR